jgi:hypothetical protein
MGDPLAPASERQDVALPALIIYGGMRIGDKLPRLSSLSANTEKIASR